VGSTSIQIGDVFIRRYGNDVLDGKSRRGLSAHYDVYSMVTSVIALDDVGARGTNGLYTTSRNEQGDTSNHAAFARTSLFRVTTLRSIRGMSCTELMFNPT
jgi:hypothetical protein